MKRPCRKASQTSIIKMRELHPIPLKNFNFNWMKNYYFLPLFLVLVLSISCKTKNSQQANINWTEEWKGRIYPSEQVITTDSVSGAKVIFVTTNPGKDLNFYFDWNCWFKDQSCMFFTSDRNGKTELFGYIPKTGELVCFSPENGAKNYWFATVDFESHSVYMSGNNSLIEWGIDIQFNGDSTKVEHVVVKERVISTAPKGEVYFGALSQSADCKFLSVASSPENNPVQKNILAVDIISGKSQILYSMFDTIPLTHIQFSKYNKYLLRFAHDGPKLPGVHRMWVVDTRKPGEAVKIHLQEPGELVTHEDWWVDDQLTFCGGYLKEESHVKLISIHDQKTRIIGAGAWWENGTPAEVSNYNWWHASGARDGRWVAADNWHGKIGIIDMRTSHLQLLTTNHRTYGRGEHPHVGWAPDSKSVEFTSNQRGNADVVIAYLPLEKWDYPFEE